jgi:lysozyme family protein
MARAEKLIPFILKWEGGYVNDPLDKGGATNKGITIGTYRHFYGKDKGIEDLKTMSQAQWEKIFMAGYWQPFKATHIKSQGIANICVDWAWASGATTAIRNVQKVLGVTIDGIVGDETLTAINRADSKELFERIKTARIDFVEAIVKRTPSQKRFIKGWINRINAIPYDN